MATKPTLSTNVPKRPFGAAGVAIPNPRLPLERITPLAVLRAVFGVLVAWQERAFQRHALDQMSAHMLKDIGLSRADVEREARKPFWIA